MLKETTTFELKKKFTSNISISIAAFLNTNGGTLAMVADGPDFMTVDGVKKGIKNEAKCGIEYKVKNFEKSWS